MKDVQKENNMEESIADYRNSYRIRTYVNEDAFNPIVYSLDVEDTVIEEMEYWIGYITGDGYVRDRRNRMQVLGLQSIDKEHIEKFKEFMQYTGKIIKKTYSSENSNDAYIIEISSDRIVDSLKLYGIHPNKSHDIEINYLMWSKHFWRGLIDADGHISKDRRVSIVTGSKEFARQFVLFVTYAIGSVPKIYKDQNVYRVRLTKRNTVKLLKLLYEDANVYLERKYKKAMEVIEYPKEA